jgi:hypothetical protein
MQHPKKISSVLYSCEGNNSPSRNKIEYREKIGKRASLEKINGMLANRHRGRRCRW